MKYIDFLMVKIVRDNSALVLLGFVASIIASGACFRAGGEVTIAPFASLFLFSAIIGLASCYEINSNDIDRLLKSKLITEEVALTLLDSKDTSQIKSISYDDIVRAIKATNEPDSENSVNEIEVAEVKRIKTFHKTLDHIRDIKESKRQLELALAS